jgi:hypothetical protein
LLKYPRAGAGSAGVASVGGTGGVVSGIVVSA